MEGADWKRSVRELTESVIGSLGEVGEPLETIPSKVIRAFREALGPGSLDQLIEAQPEEVQDEIPGGPMHEATFPEFIRRELETIGKRWQTPMGAESVMGVAQRALEELMAGPVPPYWAESLESAARYVAVREYDSAAPPNRADRAGMLDRVMGLAREAMSAAPDSAMIRTHSEWIEDGPVESDKLLSMAGLFRHLIRSLDHRNAAVAAAALGIIEEAARGELGKAVPGQDGESG